MDIKITRIEVKDWTPFEFVNYFYQVRSDAYGTPRLISSETVKGECMRMQRIISLFETFNKTKDDVQKFITWAVDYYKTQTKYVIPLEIGFLSSLVRKYLNLPEKTKKKTKKREKVVLSPEMQAWTKAERERIKKQNAKRTTK